MRGSYRTVYRRGQGEITEKKSRFIADVRPVRGEEEALAFLEEVRRTYWDARHHCYAYIYGDRPAVQRCSDDGEPSGTAGRPILEVLAGEGLTDAMIVVTRYFGGTLLGTGGLVRAYQAAARAGVKASGLITKTLGRKWTLDTDYTDLGKLQYLLAERGIPVPDTAYTDRVELTAVFPAEQEGQITAALTEATGARVRMQAREYCYYGEADGEIQLFPLDPEEQEKA